MSSALVSTPEQITEAQQRLADHCPAVAGSYGEEVPAAKPQTLGASDQATDFQRVLEARTAPLEAPSQSKTDSVDNTAKARAGLGIRQSITLLLARHPEECAKVPDLLRARVNPDNKSYHAKGFGMGDVVTYVGRVLKMYDEGSAEYIVEMLDGMTEEERRKLVPEYQPTAEDLNPFPLDDLPAVVQELARASAEINKSKPELSVITMLGVASAALGKALELKTTKGRRITGNLMMVVSMPTGTGKTSEAGPILEMVHEFQRKLRLEHRKSSYRKQAELSKMRHEIEKLETAAKSDEEPADQAEFDADMERLFGLKDEEAALMASMVEPSVVTEDATGEGFIMAAAANNGVIASMSSDARDAFANLNGRYSNNGTSGASIFIKGYSGDTLDQVRVGRGTLSTKPRVTVLWLVQPDCLKGLFSKEEFRVSGLAPRFLVARVEPNLILETYEDVEQPQGLYAAFQARLDELLTTYYKHVGTPHEIKPTFAAGTVIVDYRNEVFMAVKGGDLPGCEEFATRWAEQAWRIALVLHALEHGGASHQHELAEHTARAAVKVAGWFSMNQVDMIAATSGQQTDQKLGVAQEFVRTHQEGVAPYELYRKHQGMFNDAKDAKATLDELVAEGGINRTGTGSRVKYAPRLAPKRR